MCAIHDIFQRISQLDLYLDGDIGDETIHFGAIKKDEDNLTPDFYYWPCNIPLENNPVPESVIMEIHDGLLTSKFAIVPSSQASHFVLPENFICVGSVTSWRSLADIKRLYRNTMNDLNFGRRGRLS